MVKFSWINIHFFSVNSSKGEINMQKTMKKILSIFLVTLMMLTSMPLSIFVGIELPDWGFLSQAADDTVYTCGLYDYTIINGNEAKLVTYKGEAENVEIPESLDGHRVTTIGDSAFSVGEDDISNLISVVIPSTVRLIERAAFNACFNLERLEIIGKSLVI